MNVTVRHAIGDLARDASGVVTKAETGLPRVVRRNGERGNKIARAFASEQHTMNSDIDVPYQESFSAEGITPLVWAYGPVDDGRPHGGGQARGYENGSRNQRPHLNLDRSIDIIGPAFAQDVGDTAEGWFW